MHKPPVSAIAAIILALMMAACAPPVLSPTPETEAPEPAEEATAQEQAPVVPPPMDDPSLLPIDQFQMVVDDLPVDVAVFREGWGKTYAAGAALDPAMPPSNKGFPPFVFVDFTSPLDEVFPDPKAIFTMDVAQGRIFPVAPYLAMYEEAGRDYAQNAVTSLQQILAKRPETLDDTLLTLPGFGDAQQGVRGSPTYIDFEGGSGVGFVAGYGQEIGPLLNDTLVYQFVGLNDDGTQYISFVFPLEANFLHDLDSVTQEEIDTAEADLTGYLAGVTQKMADAADSDYAPDLSALKTAMQTIVVGDTADSAGAEATGAEFQVTNTVIPCPMNLPEGDVDGETVVCGQVTVPENWEEPGERTIDITYAILKARSQAPYVEPIIYLEGGPGGSALEDIENLSGYFTKLRETRDFIMYDQRGTAYSGNLECPAAVQAAPIGAAMEAAAAAADEGEVPADASTVETGPEDEAATEAETEPPPAPELYIDQDPGELLDQARSQDTLTETACRDYFEEQGTDLTQYTTEASIRDLIALMGALEYDVYNVYGISYGTRLGLELMRAYEGAGGDADVPEIRPEIRGVVIDGVAPPHVDTITENGFTHLFVTLRTLSDCEADEACGAAYPNIRHRALDLLAGAQDGPLEITSSDGTTATVPLAGLTALLTGATFTDAEDLKPIGYEDIVPYLPRLVDELERGVADTYLGLKQGALPPGPEPEPVAGRNPFDPMALRSWQLSEEAETLAEELATMAAQAQRAGDALASNEPLPEFFVRELIHEVQERTTFEELGGLAKLLLILEVLDEPNRETLTTIVDTFELPEASRATLQGIMNLMTDQEVAEAVQLTLTDHVLEQLTQAIQSQMNTAVLCNDLYPRFDVEAAFEAYHGAEAPALIAGADTLVVYIARCERYNLTPEAGESVEPVTSDLPVLVVNGGIDAVTAAEWGVSAAETLPNAQLVTIPMYGHGASALSECGQDIVRAFFTYPGEQVDDTCTEALQPQFVLPDEDLGIQPADVDMADEELR